ncbi:FAD binding domain-containing protein [Mycena polygramma]|nr:FAD binding domain-containing protein [Mycena polygramma]
MNGFPNSLNPEQHPQSSMASPSVLIAGAGPSGLVLALVLLKNGVSVRIIDKELKHRVGSRGSGIMPRTLELYDILGILPDIQKEGQYLPSVARYGPGQTEPTETFRLAEWVDSRPDMPHANAVSVGQDRHEEILRNHLRNLSSSVELGSELRSFEQFADHIIAHIVKTDSNGRQLEERTRFDWLIGTDGAHSVVRKRLGLSFLGETPTEQPVALGDIAVEEGIELGQWHMWDIPPKFILLRSSGATSKEFMFFYTGGSREATEKPMTCDEFVEAFYETTGRRDIKFGSATWLSTYRPNMRMVDRMRDGRVFIAGDAAHCHSPTGGQGLNSSVQDAANLGWKLALVHKGFASPALLDTYGEERLRVIAHMLKLTTDLYNKSFSSGSTSETTDKSQWNRGGDLRMMDVNYCGSSIVLEDGAAAVGATAYSRADNSRVQAAYRAPDAPGLVRAGSEDAPTNLFTVFSASVHTVLIFGGDVTAGARVADVLDRLPEEAVRVVYVLPQGQTAADLKPISTTSALVLEDREGHAYAGYGLHSNGMTAVAVRPDGVVGTVASDADDAERYFRKILL